MGLRKNLAKCLSDPMISSGAIMTIICAAIVEEFRQITATSISEETLIIRGITANHVRDL